MRKGLRNYTHLVDLVFETLKAKNVDNADRKSGEIAVLIIEGTEKDIGGKCVKKATMKPVNKLKLKRGNISTISININTGKSIICYRIAKSKYIGKRKVNGQDSLLFKKNDTKFWVFLVEDYVGLTLVKGKA